MGRIENRSRAGVEAAFEQACDALVELAPGRRLLLACSAGGDSLALMELVVGLAPRRDWVVGVVHVDHRQRSESADEARLVANRAASHGLPFILERFEPEQGPLTEDQMRQGRHACFERAAAAFGADVLLLAHHADDRVETFLIRLLAGSGPTGLASIRPIERIGHLTLVRPLLTVRRAALRQWLSERDVTWAEDPTNASGATRRGWIRNELLPALEEKIGLDPAPRILNTAELAEQEAGALAEAANLILERLARPVPDQALGRLDLTEPLWLGASAPLRQRLLRQWLWQLRPRAHPPGRAAVQEALAFVDQARAGAELRTIDLIRVVHLRNGLLAFAPEVDAATRQAIAAPLIW